MDAKHPNDLLDMAYINSLPQPLMGKTLGGGDAWWWPVHDIEVQTGLVRIDVCGLLEAKHIGDFSCFRDDRGVEHRSEGFFSDANEEERAPIAKATGSAS